MTTPEGSRQTTLLLRALWGFETALRGLDPLAIPQLREELLVHVPPLEALGEILLAADRNAGQEQGRQGLLRACELTLEAIRSFGRGEDLQEAFTSVHRAARKHCQAQEVLFPLCRAYPEVSRYFAEAGTNLVLTSAEKGPGDETGLFHSTSPQGPYARGGYSLYIPETHPADLSPPLVVALHGGYGHGRDFIWTWLREARSRGFVLLAPTSLGRTWSILDPGIDGEPLNQLLEEVCSRCGIDRHRILLTGMSDGGTFALAAGISPGSPYQAIAPVSCTLPPVDMGHAKGKRLLWVHGARDWMFPVSRTVQACNALLGAGADIRLRVVPDLSHTYPREENTAILQWFEAGLPDRA